jgi:acetyl esterase
MLRDIGRATRGGTALGAFAIVLALAACTATPAVTAEPASLGSEQQVPIYPDVSVEQNLVYSSRGGQDLLLDVCSPADASPDTAADASAGSAAGSAAAERRAVLAVHGGSWRRGDKADPQWRSICEWLASEGFVAFSVNYSLTPAHRFPDGIEDVRAAVRWLRQDAQVARYGYDPAQIGVFGGSAGGNLAALLGVEGSGDLAAGSRVAAVVELSGPMDLTANGRALGALTDGFLDKQLEYLACDSYDQCPQATDASPLYQVDASDPPFLIANSRDEFMPLGQSRAMVDALRAHGVDTTFVAVDGKAHSVALLDDAVREQIAHFLRVHLAH